jgi:PPP family 3-phenylpropionic acid transporter
MSTPYWRLSGFYFFYFAFVGAFAPYWGLYLKHLSFSALEIGVLMSTLQVMRMFAPNVWGHLADRTGHRARIIHFAAIASLVSFLGVFLGSGFTWLLLVMSLMSFFWSASLPLVEATTLSHLGKAPAAYGRIRLWGSVGFIVTVLGVGAALDYVPIQFLPAIILVWLAGIVLFAGLVPDGGLVHHDGSHEPLRQVLRRPEVLALLAASFLMSAAHGPYYTFFSIYLEDHGYSKTLIGWLWAVGVICEIGIFIWQPRLFAWVSLPAILAASFALAVLRFLLIAWAVDSVPAMLFAQTLHAFTFGAHHAAAVALIHHYFIGPNQARGQALYTSVSFGAGGTVGSLYSGFAWDGLGAGLTFSISALCTLLALGLVLGFMRSR